MRITARAVRGFNCLLNQLGDFVWQLKRDAVRDPGGLDAIGGFLARLIIGVVIGDESVATVARDLREIILAAAKPCQQHQRG